MTTTKPPTTTTTTAAPTATMRAVVHRSYGGAEVLEPTTMPSPRIAADEVLVRVHAAGLDRGTWHLMAGRPYAVRLGFGLRRPKNPVPGRDLAGVVEAVGSAVTRFAVGDEVYGIGRGTFAELTAARENKLAHKPSNLTFAQAAVVPISALTALQAVRDAGRVRPGQKVLVTGASGGVGSYAVQIAKVYGAEVTAVASTAKLDLVRSLGADHVVDYTREDFADGGQHYDVIVDIAGNPSLRRLRRALAADGTAVMVGGEDRGRLTGGMDRQLRGVVLSWFVGQRLRGFLNRERGSVLEQVSRLVESGAVTPRVDRTFPLERAPEAMGYLEAGSVRGKVAITV
jgi:NADPH:quinone reductase-like Zn-dependent oxidoreductase